MAEAIGQDETSHQKRITTNSTNIALELAAHGAGLVVTQRSLAQLYIRRGLLVEPLSLTRPSPWAYYLSANTLSRGSHHRILRDWLMARARADFPNRRDD
jgi:DNA-binding transcriptional LysR family regulator